MRQRQRGVGLALAGGGPLGGIYEIGALIALADSLDGIDLTELDVYVGVSSGAFIAGALANGISPAQMHRLFIDEGRDAALRPALFLRPAFFEFGRRLASLPRLLTTAGWRYLRKPSRQGAMEYLSTLSRAIPTGIFDNRAVDDFLTRLFAAAGRSNDFRELRCKLYLVATSLDHGASVTFGTPGHDHVPISRAIEASCALPGLFPPVEIDGEHYVDGALNKTLHASLALQSGAKLLLCVNPLVPFDASAATRTRRLTVERLNHGGLPLVLSQTFRAIIHSRMRVGMEKYERQFPDADIVLFEPAREDAEMFFAGIFGYARRRELCALAFATTREALAARAESLEPILARHGIALRRDRLASPRRVEDALCDPRPLHANRAQPRRLAQTTRELAFTLSHLERSLHELRAR